jgi:hypothetical protein
MVTSTCATIITTRITWSIFRTHLTTYTPSSPENTGIRFHGIGLPILAAPFYAVGGRAGVVGMLTLMTVLGIRLLWSLMQRAGFGPKATTLGALVALFTLPASSMAGQVRCEIPAFLCVALVLWAIFSACFGARQQTALIVSFAVLPWLHPKYIALATALLASAVLAHPEPKSRRALAAATGVLVVSTVGLALISQTMVRRGAPGSIYSYAGGNLFPEGFPGISGGVLLYGFMGGLDWSIS